MTELSNGFRCMYPDCFNCDHPECDAPSNIDSASKNPQGAEGRKRWAWSDEEFKYLAEHPLDSIEDIAKALGRSISSVKNKINLNENIQRTRSAKRQELILGYIQTHKNIRTAEIAGLMRTPIGVVSNDIRRLQKKYAEIKRKNGKIKWIECV